MRNGDWLQTYSGGQMYPLDPRPGEIDIQDIAHALGNLCRFNGHVKRFYSVAEHSFFVSVHAQELHVASMAAEKNNPVCRRPGFKGTPCDHQGPGGFMGHTCGEKRPPEQVGVAGLLHDASEAYLCDVPRPIKRSAGFAAPYLEAEGRLMRLIAVKFGFDWPLPDAVSRADNALLCTEAAQLMAPLHPEWKDQFSIVDGLTLPCWTPGQAREEFLRRYFSLREAKQ